MEDINDYVSIAEYCNIYGLDQQSIKKKCQRGTIESARKIGRNWCINKNEVPADRRITTGEYKNWRKK